MSLLNRVPCMLKACSRGNVPCMLTCSRGNVPCVPTCSRANVPCMLMFSRALCVLRHHVPVALHTYLLMCKYAILNNVNLYIIHICYLYLGLKRGNIGETLVS